ncbi:MAG: methylenetetrahydrofolate reductase [Pseudomonadales bacterium]|nr:methylenetetrahydrofolate reductase [Pseudomonadales bacterium]
MNAVVDTKQQIRDFLADCSLEVTPGGASKIENFQDILRPASTVFVTFLPGSDFQDTIKTVKRLHQEGMNPVPHFAARSIPSKKFLEENLIALQAEARVSEVLIIGGGVDKPLGDFSCTMEVLRTGLMQKHGITRIGIAGHPEGSPDIPEADVRSSLLEKNAYAKEHQLDMYITTQFCFEAEPIIAWDRRIREEGNELPIHIGIPGLATIKTLLNHARACGIGASMRVITRQAANITKLMTTRMPDKLVRELAAYQASHPDCGITQCHLYPLGGLKKSAAWLYAVQDGLFTPNPRDGFKLDIDIG